MFTRCARLLEWPSCSSAELLEGRSIVTGRTRWATVDYLLPFAAYLLGAPRLAVQVASYSCTIQLLHSNCSPRTDRTLTNAQSLTLLRASLTARFLLFELTIFVDSSLCEINFSFENWIRFHIRWEGFRYRSLRHCCVSLRGELSEGIERSAPADFNCTHLAEVFWLRTSERTTRAFRRRFGELSSVVRYSHRPSAFC